MDNHNSAPASQIGTGTAQAPQKGTTLRGDPTPYRKPWTDEEISRLKESWPRKRKEDILSLIPRRTWYAMEHKASRIGLGSERKRPVISHTRPRTIGNLPHDESVYLAGLIDGEGTITICRNRKKLAPSVSIGGTNNSLLFWLKKRLPGRMSIHDDGLSNHKPRWMINMGRMSNVIPFLMQILPFLIVKRKQAELLLEYCNLRLKGRVGEYKPRIFEIAKEIRYINKKGRT